MPTTYGPSNTAAWTRKERQTLTGILTRAGLDDDLVTSLWTLDKVIVYAGLRYGQAMPDLDLLSGDLGTDAKVERIGGSVRLVATLARAVLGGPERVIGPSGNRLIVAFPKRVRAETGSCTGKTTRGADCRKPAIEDGRCARHPLRRCKACGAKEQINELGFTTVSPAFGVCADCINKATKHLALR